MAGVRRFRKQEIKKIVGYFNGQELGRRNRALFMLMLYIPGSGSRSSCRSRSAMYSNAERGQRLQMR